MSSSIMEAQRAPGEGLPSGPHLRPDHAEILALRAASAASGLGAKHMVLKKRIGRGLYAGTDRARRCRSRAARRARNAGGAVETDNRRFVVAASRPRRRRSEQRRRVANTSMDANQSYRLSQAGYPAVTTTLMLIGSGFDGW
jgi:hypothetical protein